MKCRYCGRPETNADKHFGECAGCGRLESGEFWQTKARGTNEAEYKTYLALADDGHGVDITTGRALKTFDEWVQS